MKHSKVVLTLALLLATLSWAYAAVAQEAHPTATRQLQLSAFGAVSGVFTGLEGGKNFAVTAGGDLGLPAWLGIRPTIEIRGRYPTDHGLVDSQKDILGGLPAQPPSASLRRLPLRTRPDELRPQWLRFQRLQLCPHHHLHRRRRRRHKLPPHRALRHQGRRPGRALGIRTTLHRQDLCRGRHRRPRLLLQLRSPPPTLNRKQGQGSFHRRNFLRLDFRARRTSSLRFHSTNLDRKS